MSAEGAAQWECRALRPSDYGSRSSPPSRAGLFTAGPSVLARPVPSGSWCKQNNIFMCLGVRRTCKTAVRVLGCGWAALCSSVVAFLTSNDPRHESRKVPFEAFETFILGLFTDNLKNLWLRKTGTFC